ncbi:hypothetical protein [Streptomyces sp. NPDC088261]|uniref:hypothetical protein n=1 Tax=Streptomyces sp. NPDC088261 TaxID=3365851 RepID=UPI003825F7CB
MTRAGDDGRGRLTAGADCGGTGGGVRAAVRAAEVRTGGGTGDGGTGGVSPARPRLPAYVP